MAYFAVLVIGTKEWLGRLFYIGRTNVKCLISFLAIANVVCMVVGPVQGDQSPRRGRFGGPPAAVINYLVPNSSALAAAADIDTIPIKLQPFIRYLSLYNIPEADRPKLIQEINFMLYSLSRARVINPVSIGSGHHDGMTVIPNTDNSLVRICILNFQFYDTIRKKTFGWHIDDYEKFADVDPYFHAELIKTVSKIRERRVAKKRYIAYGQDYNGNPLYRTEIYYDTIQDADQKDSYVRSASPPWCDSAAMSKLITKLNTKAPLLRADWFFVQIVLPPFYHDLAGLGNTVDEFLDAFFIDKEQLARAKLDIKGVVVTSGTGHNVIPVSRNQRTITRFQTLLGPLWQTHDTDKSVNNNDYMRILVHEKFKATELIGAGRNGLHLFFLAQGNDSAKPGARQDEAPINIVIDNSNVDRRVRNGRSCITCHLTGIQPFQPFPQELVKHGIDVLSPDKEKATALKELYVNNVADYVKADQLAYAKAVKAATVTPWSNGLTVAENAAQFSRFYDQYQEALVTPGISAYDCGTPIKTLLPALAFAKNDPYLVGLSKDDSFLSVRRDNWEQSFQQAMILVLSTNKRKQ